MMVFYRCPDQSMVHLSKQIFQVKKGYDKTPLVSLGVTHDGCEELSMFGHPVYSRPETFV